MSQDSSMDPTKTERRQISSPPLQMDSSTIKTGLRLKFIAVITLLGFGVVGLYSGFSYREFKASLYREFNKRGVLLAQKFAAETNKKWDRGKGYQFSWEKSTEKPEDGLWLEIINASGKSLTGPILFGPAGRVLPPARFFESSLPKAHGREEPPETLTLRLAMSVEGVERELLHKRYLIGGFLVLLFLTGILQGSFLSRLIVDPIQRLAKAMKAVVIEYNEFDLTGIPAGRRFRREKDLDLNIKTRDEIEQLSDEFQMMVKKLESSYERMENSMLEKVRIAHEKSKLAEDLKEVNRKNEETIKERTREVVEKNLRLYEVSEELQYQKEILINMNVQLEKTSRMKSEFLASMSHELRTPLNSIIGFAEVLQDKMFGGLNERQEKYLSNILASGRHLLQLINNILDISKVEAGKMNLNIEPYSANRVIDEVQGIIKTLAYKKNIEIKVNLGADLIMRGDAAKMKQILYNLLSNAIKFTDEKGFVTVSTQEIAPGKSFEGGSGSDAFTAEAPALLLTVADTGIGIKPEDQERIFTEFEQTEQTRKRRYEGTGLGLALTRKLVHLHGGKIWVKSVPGEGSQFFVLLPVFAVGKDNEATGQELK